MSTEIAQRTPMQTMVERVSSDEFKQQIAFALPENVKPERFARVAITALLQSGEQLAKCEPNSVYRALIRSAQDGLLPDGREAALVAYNTKVKGQNGQPDSWETRAQYLPMVGGLRKIAAEHGWSLRTNVVYDNDEFEFTLGITPTLLHRPVRPGAPRGDKIAAYAVAKHSDGRVELEVMYADEIARARNVSRAKDRGPWVEWEDRMWEKTVGKRLFAKLPLADADKDRISRIVDEHDVDPADAARMLYGPPLAPPSSAPREIAAAPAPAPEPAEAAADAEPEPEIEEEPGFTAPAAVQDDEVVLAAKQAAQVQIPTGKHKGLALAELLDKGDEGVSWLRWALRNIETPADYRTALWSFARVYAPEVFQQVLAEREASAA